MKKIKYIVALIVVLGILTGCAADEEEIADTIVDTAIKVERVKNTVDNVADAADAVKDAVVEKVEPEKTFSNNNGLSLVAPGTWIIVDDVNTELLIKNDEDEEKFVEVTYVDGTQNVFSDMVDFICQEHALYIDGKYTSGEVIDYYRQQYSQESLEVLRPFWEQGSATRAELETALCKGQAIKTPLAGGISFTECKMIGVNIMGEKEYCFVGTYYDEGVGDSLTMFKTNILSGDISYCILAVGLSDVVNENEMVSIIESFTSEELKNSVPSQEVITFDKYLMTEADYIAGYIDCLEAENWAWAVYDSEGHCDLWRFVKSRTEPWKGCIEINDEYVGDFNIEQADEQMANGSFHPASGGEEYPLTVYFENDMPVVTIGQDVYVLE